MSQNRYGNGYGGWDEVCGGNSQRNEQNNTKTEFRMAMKLMSTSSHDRPVFP